MPPVSICVLTPMTWPRALRSGPPELPVVDRGVGLDDVVDRELVGRGDQPLQRADDAGGRRAVEAERIADRDDRVADPHVVGVAERQRGEGARARVDPEDGEVRRRIGADELGLDRVAVREADADRVGAFDDVVVRDDVAGLVDDEAGAERPPGRRSRRTPPVEVIWTTPGAARS